MTRLTDHRRDLAYCAWCPKLCNFSCPVSSATRNESHTPQSKMAAAHEHLTGARGLDEHSGEAVFACTGCGRCGTHCRHGNEVATALVAARAVAGEEGEAPKAIDKLKERFAASGNPYGIDLGARARELSRETEGLAYFPGCTALAREPSMVCAALDAASGFGLRLALSKGVSRCCGYPLWAAGLRDEFAEHARGFAREVANAGELVVGDPGCAWAMLKAYPEAGINLAPKVVLLLDLLAERADYAFGRAPLQMKVSYHDACLLGRGLGRYEGPRRLLRAAVGDFHEAAENRADAGCSGGGGLLPLTMPEVSARIALTQAEAQAAPEHRVVTGCPTAARNFRRAGVDALDLFTVLARWIAARDEDDARG